MGSSGNMKSFYRQTKKNAVISKRTPKAKASPKPTTTTTVSNKPSAANLSFDIPHNGLEKEEEALRQFDLNTAFGPCIGMSRLARWERARRLGLSPLRRFTPSSNPPMLPPNASLMAAFRIQTPQPLLRF